MLLVLLVRSVGLWPFAEAKSLAVYARRVFANVTTK